MLLKKKKKITATLTDVLDAVNKGFTRTEERFSKIEGELHEFKAETANNFDEITKRFSKVDHAIESVKDDLKVTEDVSVANLQHRMATAEKDIRNLDRRTATIGK
jgi:predicted  nucleic acid-binding Zn-ribbon protein